ncbi:MAG: hypothetical protein H0U74_00705 [Bradymonadaceae bacterium]|nr:hypothetical protein [Lujinxingiaceae bacterium]
MKAPAATVIVLTILAIISACAGAPTDEAGPATIGSSGLGLTIELPGDTDVRGFQLALESCHASSVVSADEALAVLLKPSIIADRLDSPFDTHVAHHFADRFVALEAGCYNVFAQPVDMAGQPSSDCASASAHGIEVHHGLSSEIQLISRCKGKARTALDAVAAINHSPLIVSLVVHKFDPACSKVEVCASATDANLDPLEFDWGQNAGPAIADDFAIVRSFRDDDPSSRAYTECVTFTVGSADDYQFTVAVHDLMDQRDGQTVRIPGSEARAIFAVSAAAMTSSNCPAD